MPDRINQDLPKVAFASLGCPKNLVDSEVLLGALAREGFAVCEDFRDADVIVVNTCCFIRAAEAESSAVIREALDWKRRDTCRGVVVTGCLPQRHGAVVARNYPGVDAFLGISERDRIAAVCREILERTAGRRAASRGPLSIPIRPPNAPCSADVSRLRLTPRHYAYLRIAEGCNHTCAFCAIPRIRGPYRSKPLEVVLDEARELVDDGAREILLIAQDTTAYGMDLYRRRALPDLIRRLARLRDIEWIRILYAHPLGTTDDLMDVMSRIPKVVPYLDLPLQHVTDRMLRIMRRGHSKASLLALIDRLRSRIPRLALRTTVLVGHPGETPADVDELIETLQTVRFERLGAFAYSREKGTRAAAQGMDVSTAEGERRRDLVMRLQRSLAFARNRRRIGETVPVIVDAPQPPGRGAWRGRTDGDAPDIDAAIYLTGRGLHAGRIARARISGSRGYDLIGHAIDG